MDNTRPRTSPSPSPTIAARAMQLLAIDPRLGGVIAYGMRIDAPGRRIPSHSALTGYYTPWGYQPGLLDADGLLSADLDVLQPEALALIAQRLDAGGCTLVASCHQAPWAHLADRVAFLVTDGVIPRPPRGRWLTRDEAVQAVIGIAVQWQVAGNRAEDLALRTAYAIAKVDGRRRLSEGDVAEAVLLVLGPRANVPPPASAQPQQPKSDQRPDEQAEAPPIPVSLPPLPVSPVPVTPSLHGAAIRSTASRTRRGTLDLLGTLLAALPWQRIRGVQPGEHRLAIRPGDLRWHLRRPRRGRLVIFIVDGSGSMGPRRLGQAKGAVLQLLQVAYRHRDQVALIAVAGRESRLLLPPARAVEQARTQLVALPAGGATPLADGLLRARTLAIRAKQRDGRPTLAVLLTDGRATQPLPGGDRQGVREELRRSSLALRAAGVKSVVLSTPGAEAVELARWLGGQFHIVGRGPLAAQLQSATAGSMSNS